MQSTTNSGKGNSYVTPNKVYFKYHMVQVNVWVMICRLQLVNFRLTVQENLQVIPSFPEIYITVSVCLNEVIGVRMKLVTRNRTVSTNDHRFQG